MTTSRPMPRAFHIMAKPRGPICNLDCQYCYYLPKEQMYPGSDFHMTDEVLEEFTKQYIESQRVPEVTFGWQGGEPTLMGLDFFKRAVELQQKYNPQGKRIINTLQTNGTLIDEAFAEFFHEHNFLIGLSLDGPQAMHDAFRVDKAGQPTWHKVMNAARLFNEHEVEYNILCTVHSANGSHPQEVYRFFRDEVKADFVQFIPIVRRDNTTGHQEGLDLTDASVSAEQFGQFLIGVFDEWVKRDVGKMFVQIFDVSLAAWSGQRPGLCVFEPTCGLGLAMEHNGDLYACDHYVEPDWLLGNIMETPMLELVASDKQREFGMKKLKTLPRECLECDVRFVCNGACPKNRVEVSEDGTVGLNHLCVGYKAFFHHIDHAMTLMVDELRHRRPPSNVMQRLIKEEHDLAELYAHTKRNDPCPCGSGLKFKNCHGKHR